MSELYRDLQSVGCAQLTSMIIGFPYQDEETVWREFEQLMALEPSLTQCLIYFAFPGTPFHRQVVEESRYLERYRRAPDLRKWDGFSMFFEHPRFDGPEAVEALQREIYDEDFRRLGPSPLRSARVWLTGYENLRNDSNPLLRARAERLRGDVRAALPAVAAALAFPPSDAVRDRALALRRDIVRLTGEPSPRERVMEQAAPLMYRVSRVARKLGLFQQPGLLRTEHRTGNGAASAHTARVMRLQGGAHSGLLRTLAEDVSAAVRGASVREAPAFNAAPSVELRRLTTEQCPMPLSLPLAR